jgi:type II secretory pathway pseudopilin PulG
MRRRQGFTITELLVAFALIIFIMVILTEAFSAGLESFRQLKAIGDMQEKLRAAFIVMKRDLQAEHFEDARGNRLSDIDLRSQEPPDAGYFRLWQRWDPTAPNAQQSYNFTPSSTVWCSTLEGVDNSFIPVTRATEHVLAFTVRLRGPMPGDYFTAPLPGVNHAAEDQMRQMCPPDFWVQNTGTPPPSFLNPMYSQWAEVAYFLKPVNRNAGATPLYALYRRQRLLGAEANAVTITWAQRPEIDAYAEVSFPPPATGQTLPLNDLRRITIPENRFGSTATRGGVYPANLNGWTLEEQLGINDIRAGDDLLITNVISFDVKAVYEGFPSSYGVTPDSPYFNDLPPVVYNVTSGPNPRQERPYQNPIFVSQNGPTVLNYAVFDTWSKEGAYAGWATPGTATSLPLKIRILALQITIRVHDDKTGLTRQTTLIQDM